MNFLSDLTSAGPHLLSSLARFGVFTVSFPANTKRRKLEYIFQNGQQLHFESKTIDWN
jgi:hypothetical protein